MTNKPSAVKAEEKRFAYIIIAIDETLYCLKTLDCTANSKHSKQAQQASTARKHSKEAQQGSTASKHSKQARGV